MDWTQKTVGRRPERERLSAAEAAAWQEQVARWNPGHALCDKGVFRFKTFEEADRWMTDQIAQKARERRSRKTSSGSPKA
jgi:hypothetical protein